MSAGFLSLTTILMLEASRVDDTRALRDLVDLANRIATENFE